MIENYTPSFDKRLKYIFITGFHSIIRVEDNGVTRVEKLQETALKQRETGFLKKIFF